MTVSHALTFGHGQSWQQLCDLLLAFGLSAAMGLEREVRGKSAGVRTQTIVGTASALIVLVSKFGFSDVLVSGQVVLDPSRVAAQIVSGIGFLGAGLIITRQGAVRGLTTAAAVWSTAAIGMAAGAGLPALAVAATGLHFIVVLGFTPLLRHLPGRMRGVLRLRVTYEDGKGILRLVITECTSHGWMVIGLVTDPSGARHDITDALNLSLPAQVGVVVTLSGPDVHLASNILAAVEGVTSVQRIEEWD